MQLILKNRRIFALILLDLTMYDMLTGIFSLSSGLYDFLNTHCNKINFIFMVQNFLSMDRWF